MPTLERTGSGLLFFSARFLAAGRLILECSDVVVLISTTSSFNVLRASSGGSIRRSLSTTVDIAARNFFLSCANSCTLAVDVPVLATSLVGSFTRLCLELVTEQSSRCKGSRGSRAAAGCGKLTLSASGVWAPTCAPPTCVPSTTALAVELLVSTVIKA